MIRPAKCPAKSLTTARPVLLQQADAAVQVHDRQARLGRGEPQHVLELARRVRVHLGGHAHLGEPEPGQPEQGVVPGHALLEQGVNRAYGLAGPDAFGQFRLRAGLPYHGAAAVPERHHELSGRIPVGPRRAGDQDLRRLDGPGQRLAVPARFVWSRSVRP